ncbi:hypothetical protein LGQ02_10515 [Bacillus shivajii]|uniref:hypothetical protein n=1 Tax=Bacillus shivajii TaxID=1983719 RepID=UPI001CFBD712|nr:hypothetical protein [Bacillus shivajii]UCZ55118.1 hypothetical protein LGQ02_10515 [Bacillus shivajii]
MKDYLVIFALFLLAISILFVFTDHIYEYPYFIASTLLFMINLGVFFTFLSSLTWAWFVPMTIVNFVAVTLIPVIEGMEWAWITVLYYIMIAFMFIGFHTYQQK